ncbi:MAG: branched-chain amino acid ABC transporter permease [Bacteroidales bacterium]|jgi:branched-chain amino acid transport system permease protein|nr:branched-chain amino acid ABC transporter permease [Bacteroidales bacterium]
MDNTSLSHFVQVTINGLSMGCVYALVAVGYGMVYGILNMINFAHGEIYMFGAYIAYSALVCKMGLFSSILLSLFFCGVLGVTVERLAYKPLREASRIAPALTAMAVALLIRSAVMIIWGSSPIMFPQVINNKPIILNNNIRFYPLQFSIIFVTIVIWVFSLWLFKYTKIGKAIRAVSQDRNTAWLMGIDADKIVSIVYLYGSILAAIAGFLIANYYILLFPLMGFLGTIRAWTAAVLGGIDKLSGAVIGGLLIGLVESFAMTYISTAYKDVIIFIVLIIILLVMPRGLLKGRGQKV